MQARFAQVVAHAPVISCEVELCALEERLDEVEHGRELGKDNDLVLRCFFLKNIEELADFSGGNEV